MQIDEKSTSVISPPSMTNPFYSQFPLEAFTTNATPTSVYDHVRVKMEDIHVSSAAATTETMLADDPASFVPRFHHSSSSSMVTESSFTGSPPSSALNEFVATEAHAFRQRRAGDDQCISNVSPLCMAATTQSIDPRSGQATLYERGYMDSTLFGSTFSHADTGLHLTPGSALRQPERLSSSYLTTEIVLRSINGNPAFDVHYPKNPLGEEHLNAIGDQTGTAINLVAAERSRQPGVLPYHAPPAETSTPCTDIIPHRQDEKLRFSSDLYTPRWVRGRGTQREGWCSLCEQGSWMQLKTSQYWYHVRFTHGVNSNTGRIYEPPLQLRVYDDAFGSTFGLCGECQCWVPICTPRRKRTFTSWFKHAHKCHRGRQHPRTAVDAHPILMANAFSAASSPQSNVYASSSLLSSPSLSSSLSSSDGPSSLAAVSPAAYPQALINASSAAAYTVPTPYQAQPQRFSWPSALISFSAVPESYMTSAASSSASPSTANNHISIQALRAAYASLQNPSPGTLHRRSASGPVL